VRSAERCARLRTAADCDLRRFFLAEAILGTNDLRKCGQNGALAGLIARPEPTQPEWRMSRQDFDFARVEQYLLRHVSTLQNILFVAPVLLFSVIAHEYAHGYAALRQGDSTALMLGRLTWNPLKHIDLWMTIILPFILLKTMGVALGGAKPVPVNPRNYRNFKRGDIIVSLAGIAINFLLAFLCAGAIVLFGLLARALPVTEPSVGILQVMMVLGI